MGGMSTKMFRGILEEEEKEPSTPIACKRKVLSTEFDPRSPSGDITRTPIQVEKTPDMVIDPRSPTCGIARTPIYSNHKDNCDLGEPPICPLRIESLSDNSTPSNITEDFNTDDSPVTGFEDLELLSRSSSEPDLSSLKEEETELIKEKLTPLSISYKETSPLRYRTKKLYVGHTNTIPCDESPKKSDKVTQKTDKAAAKSQRSPLMIISDGQRSPLSVRNVDVNSPRAIVQRKQVNKLGVLKTQITGTKSSTAKLSKGSPAKYKLFSDDKENL